MKNIRGMSKMVKIKPVNIYVSDQTPNSLDIIVSAPTQEDIEAMVEQFLDDMGVEYSDVVCVPSKYESSWHCEVELWKE